MRDRCGGLPAASPGLVGVKWGCPHPQPAVIRDISSRDWRRRSAELFPRFHPLLDPSSPRRHCFLLAVTAAGLAKANGGAGEELEMPPQDNDHVSRFEVGQGRGPERVMEMRKIMSVVETKKISRGKQKKRGMPWHTSSYRDGGNWRKIEDPRGGGGRKLIDLISDSILP